MNKSLYLVLPLVFLCLSADCAGGRSGAKTNPPANEPAGDQRQSEQSESSPGTADVIGGGQSRVRIRLGANQSVGDFYKSEISPDSAVVRQARYDYELEDHPPGMVGIGGEYIFEFEAIAEGEAEIKICNYFRGASPPQVVAVYTATVDKNKNLTLTKIVSDFMSKKEY